MKTIVSATTFLALAMALPIAIAQVGPREPAPAPQERSGGIIARQTERAQHQPGVTSELAPDAKQTATGGPAGGVPGFSGGK